MKSFISFIRVTIAGGILLLIPVVMILIVLRKALGIISPVTEKWDKVLAKEVIWGLDGHNILGVMMLLVICFIAGLFFRFALVRSSLHKVEENVLSFVPGYLLLKSMATDVLGDARETVMFPVLVKEDDAYRPGFMVEQGPRFCTVFLPEAPQVNSGELHVVPVESVIKLSLKNHQMRHVIRNLGKGILPLIPGQPKLKL